MQWEQGLPLPPSNPHDENLFMNLNMRVMHTNTLAAQGA